MKIIIITIFVSTNRHKMQQGVNATQEMLQTQPFRCRVYMESHAGLALHRQSYIEGDCSNMKDFIEKLRNATSKQENTTPDQGYYKCKLDEGVVQLTPVRNKYYEYDILVATMQVKNSNNEWFYPYTVEFHYKR